MVFFSTHSVAFVPVSLEKHNCPNFIIQPIQIRRFEDPVLDPVLHLKLYIKMTRPLCSSSRLLVTIKAPHGPAAKSTISRRLAETISASSQSGSGGSVRSLGTSKVANSNYDLTTILEAGDWSRK